jgi:hypothetical protein
MTKWHGPCGRLEKAHQLRGGILGNRAKSRLLPGIFLLEFEICRKKNGQPEVTRSGHIFIIATSPFTPWSLFIRIIFASSSIVKLD